MKIGTVAVATALILLEQRRESRGEVATLNVGALLVIGIYYAFLSIRSLLMGYSAQQGADLMQSIALAGLLVLAHVKRMDVLRAYWLTFVMECILALISQDAVQDSLHGTTGGSHPSIVGFSAAMLFALTIELGRRAARPLPTWVTVAASLLAAGALLLSFNRSSLIGVALGLVAYMAIKGRAAFVGAAALLLSIIWVAGVPVFSSAVALLTGGNANAFYNATGRTVIWERALAASSSFLPFGLGVGANDASAHGSSLVFAATFGAPLENSLFQAAVWVGYPGLLTLAGLLVLACVRVVKDFRDSFARCLIICIMVTACMSTSALAGTSLPSFFLISLALGMTRGSRGSHAIDSAHSEEGISARGRGG